ncbi:hypothetical protein J5N97_011843 [Dioscorea zingiberensis]|uniref:Uncharacterized protein n=1 Tax=Dioscorea zingiberensis TaxID=325984 RepID=A0A9D5D3T9_9LILI|nr:hypothetical protein J5N97_011843 [Dioscorea zingiberensis]
MEKGLVAVDRWVKGSQAYFLTHLHADHTSNLSSRWAHGPLFCSPISARLFPAFFPGFDSSLIRILEVVDFIKQHPNDEIIIAIDNLGKEDLLVHISRALDIKIWVWPERLQKMHMLGLNDIFTSDTSLTRVRAVPRYSFTSETLDGLNVMCPTIGILPSGIIWGSSATQKDVGSVGLSESEGHSSEQTTDCRKRSADGSLKLDGNQIKPPWKYDEYLYAFPYSDHSCFSEIQEFLKCFDDDRVQLCECLQGFTPASQNNWDSEYFSGGYCEENPSIVWQSRRNGQLNNIRQTPSGKSIEVYIYLRLAASELLDQHSSEKVTTGVIMGIVGGFVIILVSVLVFIKRFCGRGVNGLSDGLVVFRYNELKKLTKNFSERIGNEKATRSNMHFPVEALWFFMLLFSVSVTLSPAADTIFPGKSLSGGQTLISSAGNFELGFFKPGNSQNYYVGIWYKNIARRTVVWVANRDKPLTDDTKSMLKISEDGNLVILNQFKLPVWSSNVDPIVRNSIVAVLLDSGNLILRDESDSSSVLWQSFDHPTDTWLPGAKLGFNKTTGQTISLASWRNSQDPAPGIFSLDMDSNGISQFRLVWNKTQQYWSSGAWNGHYFSSIMEMAANHLYVFTNVSSVNASYFTYAVLDTQLVSSFMIDTTGQMRRREWLNDTEEWLQFCILPSDPCEVYSLCGSFGSCNTHISPPCRCMTGFQPRVARDWELNDWSSGCVRRTPLQCSDINPSSNGEKDRFLDMPNMILPENNQSVEVGSAEECQLICLKNCSCVAYSYSSRCLLWFGDLMDAKELTHVGGIQETSSVLYIRLAASELPTSRRRTKITVLVVFVIALHGHNNLRCSLSDDMEKTKDVYGKKIRCNSSSTDSEVLPDLTRSTSWSCTVYAFQL